LANFSFHSQKGDSEDKKRFVMRMLTKDPAQRSTAAQLQKEPYLSTIDQDNLYSTSGRFGDLMMNEVARGPPYKGTDKFGSLEFAEPTN
jgi:serine/threonine protein kinase